MPVVGHGPTSCSKVLCICLGTYRVGLWSSRLGAARSGLRLVGSLRLETTSCSSFALQGHHLLSVAAGRTTLNSSISRTSLALHHLHAALVGSRCPFNVGHGSVTIKPEGMSLGWFLLSSPLLPTCRSLPCKAKGALG